MKNDRTPQSNEELATKPMPPVYDFLRPKLERVAQDLHDSLVSYAEDGYFSANLDAAFHIFFSEDAWHPGSG